MGKDKCIGHWVNGDEREKKAGLNGRRVVSVKDWQMRDRST